MKIFRHISSDWGTPQHSAPPQKSDNTKMFAIGAVILGLCSMLCCGVGGGVFYFTQKTPEKKYAIALESIKKGQIEKGKKLLKQACDKNHYNACIELAVTYNTKQHLDPDKAIMYAKKACDQGNIALGCYNVGVFYNQGKLVAKDTPAALPYYEKGCSLGYHNACNNLGNIYDLGNGNIPADPIKARNLYKKACDAKSKLGCHNLARYMEMGKGGPKDLQSAKDLYEKTCNESKFDRSCNNIAWFYTKGIVVGVNHQKANILYQQACATYMPSCRHYAVSLQKGRGLPKNESKAHNIFMDTCTKGDAYSCFKAGYNLEMGTTFLKKSPILAKKLYIKACDKRDIDACNYLGHLYAGKKLGTPNKLLAIKAFKQGCALNNRFSCNNVGHMMRDKKQYANAQSFYEKACKLKEPRGCMELIFLHKHKRIPNASEQSAYQYAIKGCNTFKHADSCNELAWFVLNGKGGVPQNTAQGLKLYDQACTLKSKVACYNYGKAHKFGWKGTKKNKKTTRTYYKKACKLGYKKAC